MHVKLWTNAVKSLPLDGGGQERVKQGLKYMGTISVLVKCSLPPPLTPLTREGNANQSHRLKNFA